jgi:hypothetical protein
LPIRILMESLCLNDSPLLARRYVKICDVLLLSSLIDKQRGKGSEVGVHAPSPQVGPHYECVSLLNQRRYKEDNADRCARTFNEVSVLWPPCRTAMFRQSIEYPEPVLPGSARKSLFEKLCKTPHVSIGNLTAAYRGKRQGRHYRLPSIDVDDARLSKEWRTWARLTRRSFASAPFPESPGSCSPCRFVLFGPAPPRFCPRRHRDPVTPRFR